MAEHEFEIEILPDGEVKIDIKGVKGKKCEEYAKFFAEIVGEMKSGDKTHEYFEIEEHSDLNLKNTQ